MVLKLGFVHWCLKILKKKLFGKKFIIINLGCLQPTQVSILSYLHVSSHSCSLVCMCVVANLF